MLLDNFCCILQLYSPGAQLKSPADLVEETAFDHICFCANLHL